MTAIANLMERVERAAVRRAQAQASYRRSREMLQATAWRVSASRLLLDAPHLKPMSGGSPGLEGEDAMSDDAIIARIRALFASGIDAGTARTLYAGRSLEERPCALCNHLIAQGEVEFEAALSGEVLLQFDRHCAYLWAKEASTLV